MEKSRDRLVSIIGDLPFFEAFETDEIKRFAQNFSLQNIKEGAVLFKEDDIGDYLFFIIDGVMEIVVKATNKQNEVIATCSSGASIGEMSLLDEYERSATVRAFTDCEILVLTKSKFDSIVAKHPDLGVKVLKGLAKNISKRLRGTQGRFKDMV